MSIRQFVAAACLLVPAAGAQEPPFHSPLLNAGDYPWNAVAGDVDGDGDTDLAINSGQLWLLLQEAPGVFGPPLYATPIPFGDRIALADFDLDGDLDVGVAVDVGGASNQDKVAVVENMGDALGAPVYLDTAQDPTDIVAGDFDEDGAVDLALPCSAQSLGESGMRVSLFRGFGNGGFAPKLDVLAGLGPRSIDAGDVNLDGHLDLVVVSLAGTLRTLLGDGDAGFALQSGTELGFGALGVSLGNVTVDGVPDALVSFDANHVRVARGAGNGTWLAEPFVSLPTNAPRAVLADVDEDGDDDVIAVQDPPTENPGMRGVAVVKGFGNGAFGAPVLYASADDPHDVVVADLTQDGDLDLFVTVPQFFDLAGALLLPGDGAGNFHGSLRTGDRPTEAALADLDLDGQPELLVACAWGGDVAVHRGLGHGLFGNVQLHDFGVNIEGVVGADIVEDGLPDVLAINSGTPGGLTVRAGDGALGFGPPITSPPGAVPWGLGGGDADLDGHLDVVLACLGGTSRVLLGDGAGHFLFSDAAATASFSPDAAAFGDLDADGLPDLVATSIGGYGVTVALGEGGGHFSNSVQVPVENPEQHDVALGDLDGDDDLDIVSSGGFTGALNVLKNDGRATFTPGAVLSAPGTWSVAIADVDGDGRADVLAGTQSIATSADFGAVQTWLGGGHGSFAAPASTVAPAVVQELLVGDLDGDGRPDAVLLSPEHDALWLMTNLDGPWHPLGQGLPGTQGQPRQRGFGTLQPGAPFEFLLTDGPPGGVTWHVVGLSALNAPFKGGTLVPAPLLLNGPLPLDANGDLSLAGTWPGPAASDVDLYFQFWSPDLAAVKHYSASDALKATLP